MCFREACHLSRHQAAIHLKQKPHKCGLCSLSFNDASNLNRHKKNVHQGIKRVQHQMKKHFCNTCREEGVTRAFNRPSKLQCHVEHKHPQLANAQKEEYDASHPFIGC